MADLASYQPAHAPLLALKTDTKASECPGDLEFLGSALRLGATTAAGFIATPVVGAAVALADRAIPGDPIDVIKKAATQKCRDAHSKPKFIVPVAQ